MLVVTVEEMRAIERRAEVEYGLDSPALMEQAGRSVAELLRTALGDVRNRVVLVLVGPGNNGGDGRVMAKYLAQWGAHVTIYAWKERRLEVGGRLIPVGDDLAAVREALSRADAVADALLGTGSSRPLDPTMIRLLDLVRAEKARRPALLVLAVDLPSGLNADTGAVDEGTLAADLTVTLAFPKAGLFFFPGADSVGNLEVGGIGLPPEMEIASHLALMDEPMIRPLLPERPVNSNKGTFGKVMVLAGSGHFLGAAYLVTAAAARVGAGLVTLATTAERAALYTTMLPEATYAILPPDDAPPAARAETFLAALPGYAAVVLGPGLGQSVETLAFVEHVLAGMVALAEGERPALLVDADGLNNLAKLERWWERLPAGTIVTPHPGEMARLRGGAPVSGGEHDRLPVVRKAAAAWGTIAVLKGAATLVAAPNATTRLHWPGNPALATAGTGDVLAGAIGGLLAQGLSPFDAASAGVYLHALAGFRVSDRLGDAGALARDLLPELPLAIKQLQRR
jgi:NAD(P)H-hydrate epimerase